MTEAGTKYRETKTQLHISVRNLVEFIFREGDIDNRSSRAMSADAMMAVSYTHLDVYKRQLMNEIEAISNQILEEL